MKKSIRKIITAAAILFSAGIVNSAHAIGAIYEFTFTLTANVSSQGNSVRIPLVGVQRYAVNNHSVTADVLVAARDACRIESADDDNQLANLFGIDSVDNDVTIGLVGANVDPLSCRTANNFVFGDSQYAAFVTGVTVIESPLSGTLERFYGIGLSPQSAISAASTACKRIYPDPDNCSIEDEDVEVIRGQEFVASSGGGSGGGGSSNTGAIIGGVAVVGGLIWLLSSGGEYGEFNFSPDFGYSATESGYSANAGGRMDFRKDNWHLYFSGDGSIDGKFRYQSGGSYTADFWTAEFSESVSGKTADYDLSLSSDFGSGIWKLSPTYRLHSEYSDSEFDTQNSLNLESEFRYNNWQIRPTAGFNWREFGEFADSGTFRINAVHRF